MSTGAPGAGAAESVIAFARSRPCPPFELLEPSPQPSPEVLKSHVDEALATRWHRDGVRLESLAPPIAWDTGNRSEIFHLHAWDAISPLLILHSTLGDRTYLDIALAYANDWHACFWNEESADEILAREKPATEQFDWYDMAVGQRAYRLAYLIDTLVNLGGAEDMIDTFARSLIVHLDLLAEPSFFKSHSNHGLYQALGMLAAAKRFVGAPGFKARARRGAQMTRQMLESQFFTEGTHREHSPGYHFMILQTLLTARGCGVIAPRGEVSRTLKRAEEALMWMTNPRGGLAPFGDTDPRRLDGARHLLPYYSDPELKFIASRGREGRAPASGVRAYDQAGYAFARIHAGGNWRQSSYLAQSSGFHSRVHKHADHLNFVWDEGPTAILVDPARFGYLGRPKPGDGLAARGFYYGDPRRVYVESTRAHNCVSIDGLDHARIKTVPFGSGLRFAVETQGLAVFHSEIVHRPIVRQHRTLALSPGKFLLVADWLHDREGTDHDFDQWFQLAPEWTVSAVTTEFQASCETHRLRACDLTGSAQAASWRGQDDPMQGWVSPRANQLTPTTSLRFSKRGPTASFITLFLLDDDMREGARVAHSNSSQVYAQWLSGGEKHRILVKTKTAEVTYSRQLIGRRADP